MPPVLLLVLVLAMPVLPATDLECPRPSMTVEVPLDRNHVPVVFPLSITGTGSVVIDDVQRSCACLTLVPGPRSWTGGTAATLAAILDASGMSGDLDRRMMVTYRADGGQAQRLPLRIRVRVASALSLSPRVVHWSAGSPMDAQEVTVEAQPGVTIRDLALTPQQADAPFRCQGPVVAGPGRWTITLTPLPVPASARRAVAGYRLTAAAVPGVERCDYITAIRE